MSELYGSSKHTVSFTTLWHVKLVRRLRKSKGEKVGKRTRQETKDEREGKEHDMKPGSEKLE